MAAADLRLGSQLFFPPPGVDIVHLYRMVVLLTELNFHINEKQEILLSLSLVFDVLSFKKAVSQFHMLKKTPKFASQHVQVLHSSSRLLAHSPTGAGKVMGGGLHGWMGNGGRMKMMNKDLQSDLLRSQNEVTNRP